VAAGVEAIIEIGSTGIRTLIANTIGLAGYEILERSGKPVSLGQDVFTTGQISRESMRECILVLQGLKELVRSYGIEPAETRVIATSALREAENRDAFVDRITMRTGFNVDVIEAIEENHYMYLAVVRSLGGTVRQFSRSNSIIIEVGGGSTEVMLLQRGNVKAAHSLRLGTIRADKQIQASLGHSGYLLHFLGDSVQKACDGLEDDLPLIGIRSFIVIGNDARFAAKNIGKEALADYSIIIRSDFLKFVDRLKSMTVDSIVAEHRIPYSEAEIMTAGLVITAMFLERTGAEEIIVPHLSLRDGLLIAKTGGAGLDIETGMHKQIIASVIGLGRRYHFDESHANHVVQHSLFLFDHLGEMHGLDKKDRLLLEVAAYLHDIGSYINAEEHHKHSEYVIRNSEIFGLYSRQINLIANLVYYHRKTVPMESHRNYMSLSRGERVIVLKLSSLLRLADAIDRGHNQRFRLIDVAVKEDYLLLQSNSSGDLSLERLSIAGKGDLFEDVFGLKVVIQ
jgi:exopolyphosphatase/guanosine-5'-triphosphate,3'-diphosphate pyrophosphatase